MIYVKCRRASIGARELVRWLNENEHPASRWRRNEPPPDRPGNLVVCWGEASLGHEFAGVLNVEVGRFDKLEELAALFEQHVPVPEWATVQPRATWVGRSRHHHGANDLLRGVRNPDYWVEIVPVVDEFRVHVFRDAGTRQHVVIRVGHKVPAPGLGAPGTVGGPHPVYRSRSAGWRLDYGAAAQAAIARYGGVRDVAKRAVGAVGYDFGAVDVGVDTRTNLPVVFEVNSAPGLANGTVAAYGRHIAAWAGGV